MDEELKDLFRQLIDAVKEQKQLTGQAAEDFAEDLGEASEMLEDLDKAGEEAAKALQQYTANMQSALRNVAGSIGSFAGALTTTTGKLTDLSGGFDGLGDAALDLGKALGGPALAAGLLAKAMTSVTAAAAKQAEAVLDARDELYKMGGAGAGTSQNILDMGQRIGLTSKNLDLFTKPLKEASQGLVALGGTVGEGVKKFGEIADVGRETRMQYSRAGVSQAQLIEYQAQYLELQKASGGALRLQNKDAATLRKESLGYVDNLMKLSSLTGKSVEELQKEQDLAVMEYEEQAKVLAENAKIEKLMQEGKLDEANALKQEQEARQQFIKRAYNEFGRETGAQMGRAIRTGAVDQMTAPLAQLGINVGKLKEDFKNLKPGEDTEKYFDKTAGDVATGLKRNFTNLEAAIQFGGEGLGKQFGGNAELLANINKGVGTDEEKRRKQAEADVAAAKATGDNAAVARAQLVETQIVAGQALDSFVEAFNPFMSKFGLLGVALVGLTTAVGTAAIALKGLSRVGGVQGLLGRVGGEAADAAGSAAQGVGGGAAAGGFGKGLEAGLQGAAKGLTAFANPSVVLGAAGMGASITAIGAGIAGATWLLGKALPTLVEGLESFEELDGESLISAGKGIAALGGGLAVFGVGGAAASFGSVAASIGDGLNDFFGGKTPFDRIQEFSKLDIDAGRTKENAEAFTAFGTAMAAYGGGSTLKGLGDLAAGVGDFLGGLLGSQSPVEKIEEFGKLSINEGNLEKNAKAFAAFGNAMKAYTGGATATVGDLFSVWAESKGVDDPVEAMKKFAALDLGEGADKRVENNAKAFAAFSEAMSAYKGGGGATVGDLISKVAQNLGADAPVAEMQKFAEVKITEEQAKQVKINAEAFTAFATAMASYQGTAGPGLGEAWSKKISNWFQLDPPVKKLEDFSKVQISEKGVAQVKRNAEAFVAFSEAMQKFKGTASESMLDSAVNGFKKMLGGDSAGVFKKFEDFTKLNIDPDRALKVSQAFMNYAIATAAFKDPSDAKKALKEATSAAVSSARGGGGAGGAGGGGAGAAGVGGVGGGGAGAGTSGPDSSSHATPGGGSRRQPALATVSSKSGKSASVNKDYKDRFQGIIDWLEGQGYNIYSLGGYVDRDVRGQPGKKSVHAHGGALDINPAENPLGSKLVTDMPPGVGEAAKGMGLGWGGNWRSVKDAMHFSVAKNEGGTVQLSDGGIATGPTSGFPATLHGKEMVIPLNGDSLLEKLGTMSADAFKNDTSETASKMESVLQSIAEMNQRSTSEWVSKLDKVIDVLEAQRTTQEKTLRAVR